MTINSAKKHPAFKKACDYAYRVGFKGGMDNPEFGQIVMAYLTGYNNARKEK